MSTKALPVYAMLNAHSVALIGASADFSKISGRPLRFLLELGYQGKIYPVNSKYESIKGYQCYQRIADIPEEVELAVITLPAQRRSGGLCQSERRS